MQSEPNQLSMLVNTFPLGLLASRKHKVDCYSNIASTEQVKISGLEPVSIKLKHDIRSSSVVGNDLIVLLSSSDVTCPCI
jgi:hypothetical protein